MTKIIISKRERERVRDARERKLYLSCYVWLAAVQQTYSCVEWHLYLSCGLSSHKYLEKFINVWPNSEIVILFALWRERYSAFLTLMHKWKFD